MDQERAFSGSIAGMSSAYTGRGGRGGPRAKIVIATAAIVVMAVVLALTVFAPGSGQAPRRMESIFQDDKYLLYQPSTQTVSNVLDALRSLGADRIRTDVLWGPISPDSTSKTEPAGFDATNPSAYPAGGWAPYDRLVQLATARHIGVDFDLIGSGPLWAMTPGSPERKLANHYEPSSAEFAQFVSAVGRRYSGSYTPHGASQPLPRVSYWSIWNEPNQPGWLAPQYRRVSGQRVMASPVLYRGLVDAAFGALQRTGHGTSTDTILIGELAPEGDFGSPPSEIPIPPLPFLRAMYCLDGDYKPLQGQTADALRCPSGGHSAAFAAAHPALFGATGFSHHPYSFDLPPAEQFSDPSFVPLSDLSRLEHALDRTFAAYGVHRQIPLYLTEYGYETDPPNPTKGRFTPSQQSGFLNQAQYMAWRDPRVRAFSQFLLVDSLPNTHYSPSNVNRYWSTFQTGLLYASGKTKPSYHSYPLPIFIPDPSFAPGRRVFVWGMLRLAPNDTLQHAAIQWRPLHGRRFRTLETVSTHDPDGFLTVRLTLPGTGAVRIAWTSRTGRQFQSRAVGVRSK